MRKQFKKFGLFSSKKPEEVAAVKVDDHLVKYLYKNESARVDDGHKRKSKFEDHHASKHEPKHYVDEECRRLKHSRKHGQEPTREKIRMKDKPVKLHAGETVVQYYITPDDEYEHRKKPRREKHSEIPELKIHSGKYELSDRDHVERKKRKEKPHEESTKHRKEKESKKRHNEDTKHEKEYKKREEEIRESKKHHEDVVNKEPKRRQEDVTKYEREPKRRHEEIIKQGKEPKCKHKYNLDKDDYQWLTKKEIRKLKEDATVANSTNSELIKQFFTLDKHGSHEDKHASNRYKDPFLLIKKSEKTHKPVINITLSEKANHHERHKSKPQPIQDISKFLSDSDILTTSSKKKTKQKAKKDEEGEHFKFDDIKLKKYKLKELTDNENNIQVYNLPEITIKPRNLNETLTALSIEEKLKSRDKVHEPVHRGVYLVKHTFPIVDIPPEYPIKRVRKKNSKPLTKYYEYHIGGQTKTDICDTVTDSSPTDQQISEQIEEVVTIPSDRSTERKSDSIMSQAGSQLHVETHVSSVIISPSSHTPSVKSNRSKDSNRIRKTSKVVAMKSKIPVLNPSYKMVGSFKDMFNKKKSEIIEAPGCDENVEPESAPSTNRNKPQVEPDRDEGPSSSRPRSRFNSPTIERNFGFKKEKPSVSKETKENISKSSREGSPSSIKNRDLEASKPINTLINDKISDTFDEFQAESSKQRRPSSKFSKRDDNSDQKLDAKPKDPLLRSSKQESNEVTEERSSRWLDRNKYTQAPKRKKKIKDVDKDISVSSEPPASSSTGRKFAKKYSSAGSEKADKSLLRDYTETPSLLFDKSSEISHRTYLVDKTHSQPTDKVSNKKSKKSTDKLSGKGSTMSIPEQKDPPSRTPTFLLTKTYNDYDKIRRFQKRKLYSDTIRRNMIQNKNLKSGNIPPQILEVRYLTLCDYESDESINTNSEESQESARSEETSESKKPSESISKNDFYKYDLPRPCIEVVENEKFNELFQLPMDKALDEILHENYNFLKKDFSQTIEFREFTNNSISSTDDVSLNDIDKKIDDWYDLEIDAAGNVNQTFYYSKTEEDAEDSELNISNHDRLVGSFSAPDSEESGYSTIKSVSCTKSFFDQPNIKALLKPPPISTTLFDTTNTVNREINNIREVGSKGIQTVSKRNSHKSIQIKLSEDVVLQDSICRKKSESNNQKQIEKPVRSQVMKPVSNRQERKEIDVSDSSQKIKLRKNSEEEKSAQVKTSDQKINAELGFNGQLSSKSACDNQGSINCENAFVDLESGNTNKKKQKRIKKIKCRFLSFIGWFRCVTEK